MSTFTAALFAGWLLLLSFLLLGFYLLSEINAYGIQKCLDAGNNAERCAELRR